RLVTRPGDSDGTGRGRTPGERPGRVFHFVRPRPPQGDRRDGSASPAAINCSPVVWPSAICLRAPASQARHTPPARRGGRAARGAGGSVSALMRVGVARVLFRPPRKGPNCSLLMASPWGAAVRMGTAAGPASPVAQSGDRTPAAEVGSGPTMTPSYLPSGQLR